jgi:cytochrome c1
MTTWTISTLERELQGDLAGGVVIAHWRATAVDGDFSASSYGTCGFTPDPSASGFIAYDSLTEEDVIGWVQAAVDKYEIEASLAAQIEEDKNPTQAAGVPW